MQTAASGAAKVNSGVAEAASRLTRASTRGGGAGALGDVHKRNLSAFRLAAWLDAERQVLAAQLL